MAGCMGGWVDGWVNMAGGMHGRSYATAADGMHPTGMHSCFNFFFLPGCFTLCMVYGLDSRFVKSCTH